MAKKPTKADLKKKAKKPKSIFRVWVVVEEQTIWADGSEDYEEQDSPFGSTAMFEGRGAEKRAQAYALALHSGNNPDAEGAGLPAGFAAYLAQAAQDYRDGAR